jgi:hypothetical protein
VLSCTILSSMVSHLLGMVSLSFRAQLCLAPFCTPGVVDGVLILPSMSQLMLYTQHTCYSI